MQQNNKGGRKNTKKYLEHRKQMFKLSLFQRPRSVLGSAINMFTYVEANAIFNLWMHASLKMDYQNSKYTS